jgi:hypothetical protein
MHVIASKTLTSGATALVTSSATPGGGRRYGQFCLIRVVTLPTGLGPADYKSVRDAARVHYEGEADARCKGPRSRYSVVLAAANAEFDAMQ